MGTHLSFFLDKPVTKDGETTWERIGHDIGELYSYNLFAWLADVRNYDNIIPITSYRGTPPDMEHLFRGDYWDSDIGGDRPSTWVMASEILQALDNFQPLTFSGVLGRAQYHRWDKKDSPDCYSHYTGPDRHRRIFSMDAPQVKRETGYLAELSKELFANSSGTWINRPVWVEEQEKYNWQSGKKELFPARWVNTRIFREKPSKRKQRMKLLKYMERTGNHDIHVKWVVEYKAWNEQYSEFFNELRKLYSEHGDVRMVMSFN